MRDVGMRPRAAMGAEGGDARGMKTSAGSRLGPRHGVSVARECEVVVGLAARRLEGCCQGERTQRKPRMSS